MATGVVDAGADTMPPAHAGMPPKSVAPRYEWGVLELVDT